MDKRIEGMDMITDEYMHNRNNETAEISCVCIVWIGLDGKIQSTINMHKNNVRIQIMGE